MGPDTRGLDRFLEIVRAEWPAALAVLVLAGGHVAQLALQGDDLSPLGIPLFLAIAVFLLAEFGRRLLG